MTRLLSVRTQPKGGPVAPGQAYDSDGAIWPGIGTAKITYRQVPAATVAHDVSGKDAVLAIHGFNVGQASGATSFAKLDAYLALPPHQQFFGVLWPGDYWLPVVNYPWAGEEAARSGKSLATYLNANFRGAASISFISHSLGARVLLEAVRSLTLPVAELCITAGAVDRDCLIKQYRDVAGKAARISVLSSRKDNVLRLAYPVGNLISDLFAAEDSSAKGALGYIGPPPPVSAPVVGHPIPEKAPPAASNYGHSDYLPSSDPINPTVAPPGGKWSIAAGYMERAVSGAPNHW
ncbi:MAG: hypothetical protein JWN66_1662 [Sphingomonas bacterium]|uniref:alpha/beta hydrolase n=1 Tax=Sphingomonas bacterium TaxID=1895847 RepID=UPI0026058923|nr:alpha/beta hydrolase [Sphingomonas bacterium]MDB5704546.1 hypothetical protein [Sphingomonas bacterium]